jgi:hypothetical protein
MRQFLHFWLVENDLITLYFGHRQKLLEHFNLTPYTVGMADQTQEPAK